MTPFLLTVILTAVSQSSDETAKPRKPHPSIPSIVELTEEEEKKVDDIIDRFIQYDIGKMRGDEGKKALSEFQKLGSESVPALIRGLNRSASINHSCPVTVIAAKLQRFFGSTNDLKMLTYARDEIGAGVGMSRHAAVIQDLRFYCTTRRNILVRAGVKPISPMEAAAKLLPTSSLIEEIGKERGDKLKALVTELGQRNGDEVINTLGICAGSYEKENQQAARTALVAVVGRLKPDDLKTRLKDEKAEVRVAAVKVVSNRQLRWGNDLIERLDDDDANVRVWARESLVRLSRQSVNYGPTNTATMQERELAVKRWREWWQKQGGR